MQREYVLRIKNETKKEVGKDVGGAGGVKKAKKTDSTGGEKPKEEESTKSTIKAFTAYKAIKSVGMTLYSHNVSTTELRTGSREAQQRASYTYSVVNKLVSTTETIAVGAYVGGIVGALVGLTYSAIQTSINYALQANRLNMQNSLETISRDMGVQRATVSGSRYQRG